MSAKDSKSEDGKRFTEWERNRNPDVESYSMSQFANLCVAKSWAMDAWDEQQKIIDELQRKYDVGAQAYSDLLINSMNEIRKLRVALEKHHKHALESCIVYFEQDGKPIDISTDLGEAYSESLLYELTVDALKTTKEG